jgi:hypothetical protein
LNVPALAVHVQNLQKYLLFTLLYEKDSIMKRSLLLTLPMVCAWFAIPPLFNWAQEDRGSVWATTDSVRPVYTETFDLTLHPKAEPVPALKYKFLPDSFERNQANAALLYLKAEGFLEQNASRRKLYEMEREAAAKAEAEKVTIGDLPPHSYLETPPSKYPINEVKEYLKLTAFQTSLLEQAWLRDRFEMDRQVKVSKNPFAILLPEVQGIRDVARVQSIRCRLAIAENRIEDAIKIVGQQYAMARHIGQDDFLVSALVGCAIQGIVSEDLYYLVQHPDCPNLFWAASQLPKQLIDWDRCLAFEFHWIDLQFAMLQKVNTQPRPDDFWQQFITEFADGMKANNVFYWSGIDAGDVSKAPSDPRAEVESHIASNYSAAKEFLVSRSIVGSDKIDAYAKAQVFFMAMKYYHELHRDEIFKWCHMPLHEGKPQIAEIDKRTEDKKQPEFTRLVEFHINAGAVRSAQTRSLHRMLLVQAVEGIRMYGAAHDGKLPEALADLPYPLPPDPASGQPFLYAKKGETATITTLPAGHVRVELNIRFAEPPK